MFMQKILRLLLLVILCCLCAATTAWAQSLPFADDLYWDMNTDQIRGLAGKPTEEKKQETRTSWSYPCQFSDHDGQISYSFDDNRLSSIYIRVPELKMTPEEADALLNSLIAAIKNKLKSKHNMSGKLPQNKDGEFFASVSLWDDVTYVNCYIDLTRSKRENALGISIYNRNNDYNKHVIDIMEWSNDSHIKVGWKYKIFSVLLVIVCVFLASKMMAARRG